nr:MAG TPA: hypothetical protein [Caudoviricetes sp.]
MSKRLLFLLLLFTIILTMQMYKHCLYYANKIQTFFVF